MLIIGDLDAARQVCGEASDAGNTVFRPLLSMAEGRYDDAVAEWRALLGNEERRPDESMISQNLAVCLLYTGRLNEVSHIP